MTTQKQTENTFPRLFIPWYGITEVAKTFQMNDEQAKSAILNYHDSGICLYWDEPQLKDMLFTDPQYLTKLLSSIFTFSHNFVSEGKLKFSVLRHIW